MEIEAKRIDDGREDIGLVGGRVAAACKTQFDQMIDLLGQTLSPEDQGTLRQRESEQQRGFGAVAVGKVRAERRANP
jgi:hypothetical protein